MKIYSKYDDPFIGKERGEVPNPNTPCFVDDIGFISMESQIKSLINAGENLEAYRRGQLDYQYDVNQDIDDAVVSVENDSDFMPSIDMPDLLSQIVGKPTTETPSNSSSEQRESGSERLSAENGGTIPPSQNDAL